MSTKSAALRIQLESALGARVPAPFTFRVHRDFEIVPSGVPEIDRITASVDTRIVEAPSGLASGTSTDGGASHIANHPEPVLAIPKGGLPRGALTEIVGPTSSGRTSVMISLLAEMTSREEVCALVDSNDAFDPHSAEAAGVDLKKLLWVRCGDRNHADGPGYANRRIGGSNEGTPRTCSRLGRKVSSSGGPGYGELEQALKTTDLLLAGGGFGLVVVDLSDILPSLARRVPLAHWFRFRRTVEDTPTVLVVLEQSPYAKTCASLVLRLEPNEAYWSRTERIDDSGRATEENSPAAVMSASPVLHFQTISAVGTPPLQRETLASSESSAPKCVPHACLLRGARLDVEILRSRLQQLPVKSMRASFEVSAA